MKSKKLTQAKVKDLNVFGTIFQFGGADGVFIRRHHMEFKKEDETYTKDMEQAGIEEGCHDVALVVSKENPQIMFLFNHETIKIYK